MDITRIIDDDNQSDTSEEDWTEDGDVSHVGEPDTDQIFDNWRRKEIIMSKIEPEVRFICLTSDFGILGKKHQNEKTKTQLQNPESALIDRHSYIRLHGVTKDGGSVCCNVFGFQNYMLVLARPNFDFAGLNEFQSGLLHECIRTLRDQNKGKWVSHMEDNTAVLTVTIVTSDKEVRMVEHLQSIHYRQEATSMDNLKQSVILKVSSSIPRLIWTAANVLKTGKLDQPLANTAEPYQYEVYYGNVNHTIRFISEMNISGCSWMEIMDGKYVRREGAAKLSHAQLEVDVLHTDLSTGHQETRIPPLRVLSLDIEVLTKPPFEFPSNGTKPVLQISSILTTYGLESSAFEKFVFTLGSCDEIPGVTVFCYEKEEHLLNGWKRFVVAVDPDIFTGYNIKKFDIPYLLQRAERIGSATQLPFLGRAKNVKAKSKKIINKWKGFTHWDEQRVTVSGRIICDMYLLVMRQTTKPSSGVTSNFPGKFTLHNVARNLLNEEKLDIHFTEIWELHNQGTTGRTKLAEYCVRDSELALKLMLRLVPDAERHPNTYLLEHYIKKSQNLGVPLHYLLNKSSLYATYCQKMRKAVSAQMLHSDLPNVLLKKTASTLRFSYIGHRSPAIFVHTNQNKQFWNDEHFDELKTILCSTWTHLAELTNYINLLATVIQQVNDDSQQLERKVEELQKSISNARIKSQEILGTSKMQLNDCPDLSKLLALSRTSQSTDEGGTTARVTEKVLTASQSIGVRFLLNRVASNGNEGSGAIIACPVGTGKTALILSWYQNLPESSSGSLLVLCTKNGLANWKQEMRDWLKIEFLNKFYVLEGNIATQELLNMAKRWSTSRGILLATYNTYLRLVQRGYKDSDLEVINATFVNPGPAIIVLDEGHVVRNSATQISEAISRVSTQRKIVVTGTPLQNSLADVYALVNLVKPGSLSCRTIFNHRIEKPYTMGLSSPFGIDMLPKRGKRLHELVSTVLYSSAGEIPLPLQQEWILHLRPSKCQKELLSKFLETVYATSGFQEKHNHSVFEVESVISRLLAHPDVIFLNEAPKNNWANELWDSYTPGSLTNGVKLEVLFEIFKSAAKDSKKVLVYTKYLETLNVVENFLKSSPNYKYLRVDGSTSSKLRQKFYNEINECEESMILIMTTGSGSDSVNLHGATVTVLIDVNWNPGVDIQCQGRTRRYGHSNTSVVYRLVVDNTLDDLKIRRQWQKTMLGSQLMGVQITTRDESTNSFEFLQKETSPMHASFHPPQSVLPNHILQLETTLKSSFGNPAATPYGEPWRSNSAAMPEH